MGASAIRGAVLVLLAAVLGFLILRGVEARQEVPVVAGQAVTAATPAAVVATPTPGTAAVAVPTTDVSTSRARGEIRVLVANGTDVSGQAGRLTDVLRNQGYNTRSAVNGDAPAVGTSLIYYRPGFAAEAELVRQDLNTQTVVAPMPVPDPIIGADVELISVDVFVWVGPDELSTS